MAEDHVSKEQHRADMAELKGELKEEIAGLRHEMAAMRSEHKEELAGIRQEISLLAKTIEANQQTMLLRFEQVDKRFEQVDKRFEQMDQQRAEDRQLIMERFQQVDQRFAQHETRLLSLETWMRTTFVTLMIVAVGVAAQLFYTLLRFGLKPTP